MQGPGDSAFSACLHARCGCFFILHHITGPWHLLGPVLPSLLAAHSHTQSDARRHRTAVRGALVTG
jgi:hypothetical protein